MPHSTISYDELTAAVAKLKNQKGPGPDGYTAEYFNFFLDQIGF